jgi:hypothetical protein
MGRCVKMFVLCVAIVASVFGAGVGVKGQVVVGDDIGVGVGAGVLVVVDISDVFQIYPGFDFWVGENGEYSGRYWDGDRWVYYEDWRYRVTEFAFNIDGVFLFPVRPARPYVGFGAVPVIVMEDWRGEYYKDFESSVGVGVNMFGGVEFPMGKCSGFFELRGKMGYGYPVMKMSFGAIFRQ